MPPEIAHTDKYSENICFCCREIFFNLIYSPFFWRTGSFVEENWGVKFVSTHQPGKRALCAKYSTHTKTFPSPPEIGKFPIYLGYSKQTYHCTKTSSGMGRDSEFLSLFFHESHFAFNFPLVDSNLVFVSSVRSSYSHADLLLIQHPTTFSDHTGPQHWTFTFWATTAI